MKSLRQKRQTSMRALSSLPSCDMYPYQSLHNAYDMNGIVYAIGNLCRLSVSPFRGLPTAYRVTCRTSAPGAIQRHSISMPTAALNYVSSQLWLKARFLDDNPGTCTVHSISTAWLGQLGKDMACPAWERGGMASLGKRCRGPWSWSSVLLQRGCLLGEFRNKRTHHAAGP